MPKGFVKVVDTLAAFAVLGPLTAWLLTTLRAPDGDPATTPLTSSAPLMGAALLVAAFLLTGFVGVVSGRMVTRGRGLCMVGFGLMWTTSVTANARQLLGDADAASALNGLILEAVLLIPLIALTGLIIEAVSPVSAEEQGLHHGPSLPPPGLAGIREGFVPGQFIASLAAAVVAAGVVGWIVAINTTKGQAIFAAFLGGIAAGFAASAAARSQHKTPSLLPPVLALPVVALLTVLYLKFTASQTIIPQTRAVASESINQLFALGRILPLDWAAGGLFGVPIGASWAASMVEKPKDSGELSPA
jgi:hypothetical protein